MEGQNHAFSENTAFIFTAAGVISCVVQVFG
jgi:hypothetical protein